MVGGHSFILGYAVTKKHQQQPTGAFKDRALRLAWARGPIVAAACAMPRGKK
jgi:hypothetical protein